MYLQKCTIRNIKCFEDVTLDFSQPDGSIRLWNVIIGENGTGKSTLLQAIAIALVGERSAILLPNPTGWVRTNGQDGEVEAIIEPGGFDTEVAWEETEEAQSLGKPIRAKYALIESSGGKDIPGLPKEYSIVERSGSDRNRLLYPRSSESSGWFSAGYGPFRRLSGGSEQATKIVGYGSKEARFITLFREDAALVDCEQWLMSLDYARRDDTRKSEYREHTDALLNAVKETLNSHLLPEEVRLDTISSQGVHFRTPYADKVQLSNLSDGYRAMLALGIDLLRHLSQNYPDLWSSTPNWLQHVTGIVLVDELDAHLHPTWQRQIGFWLKERFPKLQFIVATHSPFIPQAADDGGVYILRRSNPSAKSVQAYQADIDEPSVRGWRADQILTILFDTPGMYDPETERLLREYARLKILFDMKRLPADQIQTFDELQKWVDTYLAPPGDTRDEMRRYRNAKQRAQELSKLFRERAPND